MRKALVLMGILVLLAGCKPVKGERFWWDDQKKEQLPNTYSLPDWPAASPVPTDPEPYVPKQLPNDELKRAQAEQQKKIEAGISRAGVPNPETNREKVKVAKWQGGDDKDGGAQGADSDAVIERKTPKKASASAATDDTAAEDGKAAGADKSKAGGLAADEEK